MNETSDGKNKTSILYIPTNSAATKKKKKKKFYKTIWPAAARSSYFLHESMGKKDNITTPY